EGWPSAPAGGAFATPQRSCATIYSFYHSSPRKFGFNKAPPLLSPIPQLSQLHVPGALTRTLIPGSPGVSKTLHDRSNTNEPLPTALTTIVWGLKTIAANTSCVEGLIASGYQDCRKPPAGQRPSDAKPD